MKRRLVGRLSSLSSNRKLQSRLLTEKWARSSSLDDPGAASSPRLRNSILKAPFQRAAQGGSPLFPWRHEEEPLDRLIPGTPDFQQKGYLVGGNVISSNPVLDNYATAYLFLDVPWYKMIFFSDWQADLAENMSWAFAQATAGIISNVYNGE